MKWTQQLAGAILVIPSVSHGSNFLPMRQQRVSQRARPENWIKAEMNNNLLLLIVAVAFLAAVTNLVWETWDYGFPTDLVQPDGEDVNNKEFWDLLLSTLILYRGDMISIDRFLLGVLLVIKTPVGGQTFLAEKWSHYEQTRVGSSPSNITWLVHVTDLHLSKFHAPDRTEELHQLGKS